MAQHTPHRHLGFTVQFDELIPEDTIVMRSTSWEQLHHATHEAVQHIQDNPSGIEHEKNTSLNATQIGPLDGPDAHSGPLVPVNSLREPAVLVPNPEDRRPNARSVKQQDEVIAVEPVELPYPTDPVLAAPTEVVSPEELKEQPDAAPSEITAKKRKKAKEDKAEADSKQDGSKEYETKQYSDGSSATGIAPLPDQSPEQQDAEYKGAQPPCEVFADADGKTIGIADGNGGYYHLRDNPYPPDYSHDDLTGVPITQHQTA